MQKLRNKKRLTGLVAAFMLTFVVGGAFALTGGTLDINANVTVATPDELYVVWDAVDYGSGFVSYSPIAPAWGVMGDGTTSSASIVSRAGDTRTAQRIVWNVSFSDFDANDLAVAALSARMRNNALQTAALTSVTPANFVWSDPALAAELGLEVLIPTAPPATLAPGQVATAIFEIEWDGSFPAVVDVEEFELTLSLEIPYAPAP
jgi:hypothetical protein